MGAEVVHHDDIAIAQNWNEVIVDESTKDGRVRAADVRHHRLDPVEGDRADHRQDCASISRHSVMEPLTAARPSMRTGHADVRARLVEKHETSRVDRFQLRDELGAPRLDRGAVALGGDQTLFFRVNPSFLAARYTHRGPTVTLTRFENIAASSSRVASG